MAIELTEDGAALIVTLTDTGPASADVDFLVEAEGLREENWQRLPESAVAENSHTRAAWRVSTDRRSVDRVFPSAFVTGDVAVLNLDYWSRRDAAGPQTVIALPPFSFLQDTCKRTGTITLEDGAYSNALGRYTVIAAPEADCRTDGRSTTLKLGDTPEWIRKVVANTQYTTFEDLRRGFGIDPGTLPFVLIYSDLSVDRRPAWRGDVGWRGVVFLRFFGEAWSTQGPGQDAEIAAFVAHELVHLWLGQTFRQPEGEQFTWFYEGAAEFLSENAFWKAGEPDSDDVARRINMCLRLLDGQSLTAAGEARGRLPYDCGYVFQWLVHLHDKAAGETSLWRRWSATLAASDGRHAGLSDFLSVLNDRASVRNAVASLLDTVGRDQQTDKLAAFLASSGFDVSVSSETDPDLVRQHALFHVMRIACGPGPMGYTTYKTHIELDTGDHCGPIAGKPEIRWINGADALDDPQALFAEMERACGRSAELILRPAGQLPEIRMPCRQAPPPLPRIIRLASAVDAGKPQRP